MYTVEKLKELQALNLEDKIALSKIRITEFYHNVPEDTHLYRWAMNGTLLTIFY